MTDYVISDGVTIPFVATPSLTDGKSKVIWSDQNFIGYGQCWVCGATAAQMAEPKGVLHDFAPKPNVCALGLDPLHLMMRSFDYFNKTAFHWGFKEWACYGEDNKALKAHYKSVLQDEFKFHFKRLIYVPRAGGGLTNTG